MRRDSGWRRLYALNNPFGGANVVLSIAIVGVLLVLLAGCTSWWSAGAGAAGAPCVSDADSLRARDSVGVCTSTPRVK